jgi:hypothetical protein
VTRNRCGLGEFITDGGVELCRLALPPPAPPHRVQVRYVRRTTLAGGAPSVVLGHVTIALKRRRYIRRVVTRRAQTLVVNVGVCHDHRQGAAAQVRASKSPVVASAS